MTLDDRKTSPPGHGERSVMNCATCEKDLPTLLLDPSAGGNEAVRAHLVSCSACAAEFQSLQSTVALLDTWAAPEPSPWFDSRMAARLREEQAAAPESLWERIQSRLLFNTGRQFRPVMVGALALALVVGGGTAAKFAGVLHSAPAMSATVEDLQIMDRNDQALQTMDQLLDDDNGTADDSSTPSS